MAVWLGGSEIALQGHSSVPYCSNTSFTEIHRNYSAGGLWSGWVCVDRGHGVLSQVLILIWQRLCFEIIILQFQSLYLSDSLLTLLHKSKVCLEGLKTYLVVMALNSYMGLWDGVKTTVTCVDAAWYF